MTAPAQVVIPFRWNLFVSVGTMRCPGEETGSLPMSLQVLFVCPEPSRTMAPFILNPDVLCSCE